MRSTLEMMLIAWPVNWPILLIIVALLVIKLVHICYLFISARKKAKLSGPRKKSGLEKASIAILYFSTFATFVSLILMAVFHMRQIGHYILNCSLISFIFGLLLFLFVPIKINENINIGKRQTLVVRIIATSGIICYLISMILRFNKIPGDGMLMVIGLTLVTISILFFNLMKKQANNNIE